MESLDLLANNLANAATIGYKGDQEFYGLYTSAEASSPADGSLPMLPVIERQWTDFSAGTLQPTGNQLDVGLSGRGFLAVQGPKGILYTRNGNLHISKTGELASSEGFPVRATGGGRIRLVSERPVEITTDGTVRQDGQALGQLEIVDFKSTSSLKKLGGTCFENTNAQNLPAPATSVEVQQAKLESSNVGVAESAMRLVGVMRQFEMLQKAVTLGVEMNRKAIEEVARVSA
jgi:flagellar basal-body rod protein FlgF